MTDKMEYVVTAYRDEAKTELVIEVVVEDFMMPVAGGYMQRPSRTAIIALAGWPENSPGLFFDVRQRPITPRSS